MHYQRLFMTRNKAAKKEKKIYIFFFVLLFFHPKEPLGLYSQAIVKAKLVSSFTLMLLMASGEGLERTNRSALRCQKI